MNVLRDFSLFFLSISLGLGLSSYSQAAIVQVATLWPQTHLKVCFTDSKEMLRNREIPLRYFFSTKDQETLDGLTIAPVEEELKSLIQTAVEKSFSIEKTGIVFEGWGTCTGTEEVAIFYVLDVLERDPNQSRQVQAASIGTPFSFALSSVRINRSDVEGYRSENIMGTLQNLIDWSYGAEKADQENWNQFGKYAFVKDMVHEFGHIAGLAHEQQRFGLDDLKKIDISPEKEYSDTLEAGNEYSKKIAAIIPLPERKEFGIPNPLSTMNYMTMWYDLASEQTRLICEMTDNKNLSASGSLYLRGLYQSLTKTQGLFNSLPQAAYSPSVLKALFCKDQSYLSLNAKVQFEQGTLLDPQSQNALLSVYSKVPFTEMGASYLKLIDYIESGWGSMTAFTW